MTITGLTLNSALSGLAGGVLIGLSAAIMLLGLGRIAGISGLAARATGIADSGPPQPVAWAFLAGLPIGAGVAGALGFARIVDPPHVGLLVLAGLLVGFGTRLGSGCTSGHGVCGISRLSPRSIIATLTFVGAGMVTVAVMRTTGIPA